MTERIAHSLGLLLLLATGAAPAADGTIDILPDGVTTFDIDQPGHYVLVGNVTVTASVEAIHISGSDVSLDLNGYVIDGGGDDALTGIRITSGATDTRVWGGAVRNCISSTVLFQGTTALLADLSLSGAFRGVEVQGTGGNGLVIRDSQISGVITGVEASTTHNDGLIERCRITGATGNGVSIQGDRWRIIDCAIISSANVGVSIAGASDGTIVTGNSFVANAFGIGGGGTNSVIANNFFAANTSDGIATVSMSASREWGDNLAP